VTQISDAENVIEISLKAFDYASDIANLVQGSESQLLSIIGVNMLIGDQWLLKRVGLRYCIYSRNDVVGSRYIFLFVCHLLNVF